MNNKQIIVISIVLATISFACGLIYESKYKSKTLQLKLNNNSFKRGRYSDLINKVDRDDFGDIDNWSNIDSIRALAIRNPQKGIWAAMAPFYTDGLKAFIRGNGWKGLVQIVEDENLPIDLRLLVIETMKEISIQLYPDKNGPNPKYQEYTGIQETRVDHILEAYGRSYNFWKNRNIYRALKQLNSVYMYLSEFERFKSPIDSSKYLESFGWKPDIEDIAYIHKLYTSLPKGE